MGSMIMMIHPPYIQVRHCITQLMSPNTDEEYHGKAVVIIIIFLKKSSYRIVIVLPVIAKGMNKCRRGQRFKSNRKIPWLWFSN